MKTLNEDELDALNRIIQDVNITIESNFSASSYSKAFICLTPILVSLYFKIMSHDSKNRSWKNRDMVFSLNEDINTVKNIVEIHADYSPIVDIKNYLRDYNFQKAENTLGEAIGYYLTQKDLEDNHKKYFFVIMSEKDLLNNFSSLEYIAKNKLKRIISLVYTKSSSKELNRENKINGRLISLGFDTLVISGDSVSSICDAFVYAKKIDKPTIILANLN